MFNLEGKTALITGASGGIGAEIAKALHAQGATVILHGTRQAKLDELAAEIGSKDRAGLRRQRGRKCWHTRGRNDPACTGLVGVIFMRSNRALRHPAPQISYQRPFSLPVVDPLHSSQLASERNFWGSPNYTAPT